MESVSNAVTDIVDCSVGVLWTDYDDDGDVDLFVAGHQKIQFRNDGNGTFTWIAPEKGGIPPLEEGIVGAFSSANYDNDRDLDLFSTNYYADPSFRLYYNEFKTRFRDMTHLLPTAGKIRGAGSAWGDYDNDGFQDLFITNNTGKNLLYHNDGNGAFSLVTESPLVKEGRSSSSSAWVDFDNDGDLDLMVANGMYASFEQSCEFYLNEGGSNHWIILSLVGTISNRSAIGTKVWARANIQQQELIQLREVYGGGQGNTQSDPRVHFGLGDAAVVDSLRIEWPSGIIQELENVAADQIVKIVEKDTGSYLQRP
jgi:hypothetical protein